jgi:hypothetical protein
MSKRKHSKQTSFKGMLVTSYGRLKVTTLSKCAGILDGRYSNKETLELVSCDERCLETKESLVK